MNRNGKVGISLSEAGSKSAAGMREITVKVGGSKERCAIAHDAVEEFLSKLRLSEAA